MIPSLVTLLIFNFKIDKVTLDLLIRPSTRGSNDVNNVITAVASRTRATAEAFVEKTWREAKENSGVDYQGILSCLDGYMNVALENTEEWVNGVMTNTYGDAFVRGNNGTLD